MALLSLLDIHLSFGGPAILENVNLQIDQVQMLGANCPGGTATFTATPTPTPTRTFTQVSPTSTRTSTPSLTPTLTPTPTVDPVDPTSGLDRSQLSITVQNGSGEAGVAGKASDVLKSLGYNVAGSGNADNFNYTGVTIQVKSAQVTYLDFLKKDLGFSYTISNATSDLPDSFSSDALVVIGK